MKNVKHNLVGKLDGKTVIFKHNLSYPDARDMKASWETQGCHLIVNDEKQLVKLDHIEMYPVEVLWSRGQEAKVGA